jgi:PAS domain S-box-containing protein
MILQFTPEVVLLLLAGTISLILTGIGWRNRAIAGSWAFTLLMAAETVWIFGYALELTSTSLPSVLLLNNIEYPALATVPVAWLFIMLCFTGREHYLTKRTIPLFFIVPAIVWLLVLTNPYHYLYYTGFYPETVNGSLLFVYRHGPLFWIHITYSYLLALIALVLAAGRLFDASGLYRRQTLILLFAACIPAFCNMAYVFQFTPFPRYDLTPIAFLVSGIVLALGILRYQLFSAVPVAYSLVFRTMKDGVIVTTGQLRVIDLNPSAEEITGLSSHHAIGRTITEIVPGLSAMGEGIRPGNQKQHIEISLIRNGSRYFYDVLITPMGAGGTGSTGYLCLFRDISDRKQAELALARANNKISLLTSITRHDLLNKLMAVSSYHELCRDLSEDPVQKEYLDRAGAAIATMSEQIEFTREYEQLGINAPVWQNIAAVVGRAGDHAGLRNVSLACSTGSLEVYADPMLEKVFYNLLDNAVKYGGHGMSSITVSRVMDGLDLLIIFEDNGTGIQKDDKARLFERGFGRNTGLGLFLSREILAITDIGIRETGEAGGGARFEIRVPCGKFQDG